MRNSLADPYSPREHDKRRVTSSGNIAKKCSIARALLVTVALLICYIEINFFCPNWTLNRHFLPPLYISNHRPIALVLFSNQLIKTSLTLGRLEISNAKERASARCIVMQSAGRSRLISLRHRRVASYTETWLVCDTLSVWQLLFKLKKIRTGTFHYQNVKLSKSVWQVCKQIFSQSNTTLTECESNLVIKLTASYSTK